MSWKGSRDGTESGSHDWRGSMGTVFDMGSLIRALTIDDVCSNRRWR